MALACGAHARAKVVCADCLHVGFVPRRSLPRMLCCSYCQGVAWHNCDQPDADLLALAALDAAYGADETLRNTGSVTQRDEPKPYMRGIKLVCDASNNGPMLPRGNHGQHVRREQTKPHAERRAKQSSGPC